MAIIKKLNSKEYNIPTTYHRIVSVNNITNHASIIEIASYENKEKRQIEKEALLLGNPMDVFISTEYLNTPYNENFNVSSAYEYLKSLDKFSECTND